MVAIKLAGTFIIAGGIPRASNSPCCDEGACYFIATTIRGTLTKKQATGRVLPATPDARPLAFGLPKQVLLSLCLTHGCRGCLCPARVPSPLARGSVLVSSRLSPLKELWPRASLATLEERRLCVALMVAINYRAPKEARLIPWGYKRRLDYPQNRGRQ